MDVSIETTGNLSRRLKFAIPAIDVEKLVATRIQKMGKTFRLNGFRRGKVPKKVIQERFGKQIFHEVAVEVIESSYQQAIAEHGLVPAGQVDFKDTNIAPGQDISFVAEIELYPEFEPASLTGIKIERLVAEVRDSDVVEMVEKVRLQNAEWQSVQRQVQEGDRVRVLFEEDVEVFNTDKQGELVLTIGTLGIDGQFSNQLLKANCGDRKKIKIKFPKDYPRADLAKKKIKFWVKVQEIEESILPVLDQAFFEKCGVKEGGLVKLKEILKEGMEYELKNKIDADLKNKVLDILLQKNNIEAPRTMVKSEIERMRADAIARLGIKENDDSGSELGDELFKDQATRRVKLGLIMSKVAESKGLDVGNQEFESRLNQMVEAYEDADAVRKYYRDPQQGRAKLTALILEDKVFQWVLSQLQIEEKNQDFKDVMQPA